jgi:hypothetical protein
VGFPLIWTAERRMHSEPPPCKLRIYYTSTVHKHTESTLAASTYRITQQHRQKATAPRRQACSAQRPSPLAKSAATRPPVLCRYVQGGGPHAAKFGQSGEHRGCPLLRPPRNTHARANPTHAHAHTPARSSTQHPAPSRKFLFSGCLQTLPAAACTHRRSGRAGGAGSSFMPHFIGSLTPKYYRLSTGSRASCPQSTSCVRTGSRARFQRSSRTRPCRE